MKNAANLGRAVVEHMLRTGLRATPGSAGDVDVLIDASYSFLDPRGLEKRSDKRDQNQLVLEWSGEKWLFLSGM